MKKVSMILVAVAFAVTGISAGKMSPAEKECRKKADEAYAGAKKANKDAVKDCKAKKGKERAECNKSAAQTLKDAGKAQKEAYKSCKSLPATPEVPGTPAGQGK